MEASSRGRVYFLESCILLKKDQASMFVQELVGDYFVNRLVFCSPSYFETF